MAGLGGHEPARAIVPAKVIADQTLGKVVAVALCGVNKVDAEFSRLIEDSVRVGLGKGAAPFAAQLPRAQANNRHPQTRAAENSIAHGGSLLQNPVSETRIIRACRMIAEYRNRCRGA